MIKVRKNLVEHFLIEKVPERIYKGNPFVKNNIFSRKLTQGEHQLENPTQVFEKLQHQMYRWCTTDLRL